MIRAKPVQSSSEHRALEAEGDRRADPESDQQCTTQFPAPRRGDVRAEHLDEILGLHPGLLCRTSFERAFRPRCTDTLMADSDMSVRAAASLTLSPCNFTSSIARRIFGASCAMSAYTSSPLSIALKSPSAGRSGTSSSGRAPADILVRRR